jgi:hypothetical protein
LPEEPQSAGQALYYLLTYAYAWGQQDATNRANNMKKPPAKRAPDPYSEPSDPVFAWLIHTIRIWASLPGTLDHDTLHQAIETLRAAGIVAVPEEPHLRKADEE